MALSDAQMAQFMQAAQAEAREQILVSHIVGVGEDFRPPFNRSSSIRHYA